jgi:predicted DNA-binding WGR domain protein
MSIRRLEHQDEAKFWEAWVKDDLVYCYRYGKLGSSGHTKIKKFKSRADAEAEVEARLAEKLREGFVEVGEAAAREASRAVDEPRKAPPRAVRAPVAPAPLAPRYERVEVSPDALAAAARALEELVASVGGRSWQVARKARLARRALARLGGLDPAEHALAAFERAMALVLAPKRGLPLEHALGLCWSIDAASYARVVASWRAKMLDSKAADAIAVLAAAFDAVDDRETAIHAGSALVDRRSPDEVWKRRFDAVKPSLSFALEARGSSLGAFLDALRVRDPMVERRIAAARAA